MYSWMKNNKAIAFAPKVLGENAHTKRDTSLWQSRLLVKMVSLYPWLILSLHCLKVKDFFFLHSMLAHHNFWSKNGYTKHTWGWQKDRLLCLKVWFISCLVCGSTNFVCKYFILVLDGFFSAIGLKDYFLDVPFSFKTVLYFVTGLPRKQFDELLARTATIAEASGQRSAPVKARSGVLRSK